LRCFASIDDIYGSHNAYHRSIAAEAVTLTRQSNQTAFQQKGFFAAQGLRPANQAKPGCNIFAGTTLSL
jgi:hypothetical protein